MRPYQEPKCSRGDQNGSMTGCLGCWRSTTRRYLPRYDRPWVAVHVGAAIGEVVTVQSSYSLGSDDAEIARLDAQAVMLASATRLLLGPVGSSPV